MPLITSTSPHDVGETAERIVAALARRGIELFARVDHAAGARAAGLELADEQLLVFGDPRVGTRLMQADATVGHELPLRMLVWDHDGQTLVGYAPPTALAADHALEGLGDVLARMSDLLAALAAEGAGAPAPA